MRDPALFKWRHFEAEIILCTVRWYLRYTLSYRDVEELMHERGVSVDHTTVFRWVQRYAPELERRCRPLLKATNDSYRIDETYIKIKKQWYYLYRAVDSEENTIDFMLSATRDAPPGDLRPVVMIALNTTVHRIGQIGPETCSQIEYCACSARQPVEEA